jgi:glycine dehydrogenase subunit 1
MALASAVYMSLLGKHGLREVAELCYHKAHYAANVISRVPGFKVISDQPFFNEFIVQCPRSADEINEHLLEYDILGGYNLGDSFGKTMSNALLVAVTEMNSREEIDLLAEALAEVNHD